MLVFDLILECLGEKLVLPNCLADTAVERYLFRGRSFRDCPANLPTKIVLSQASIESGYIAVNKRTKKDYYHHQRKVKKRHLRPGQILILPIRYHNHESHFRCVLQVDLSEPLSEVPFEAKTLVEISLQPKSNNLRYHLRLVRILKI